MIDLERGDLQAILVQNNLGFIARLRRAHRERPRLQQGRAGVGNVGPMMIRPVAIIHLVGEIEPCGDLFDAGRPIDWQCTLPPADPGKQSELA